MTLRTISGISNIDILVKLQNPEELDLFGCGLDSLPHDIGKLTHLKQLGLTGNNLTEQEITRVRRELPHCYVIFR